MERLILLLLCLYNPTHQLSQSEEQRLILNSDTSVIDEKLRELPGGVLIPPEIESLPVPRMEGDVDLKQIQFDNYGNSGNSGNKKGNIEEKIRSVIKSMRRLNTYQTPQVSSRRLYTPRTPRARPTTSSVSNLEMALKRIEILASRAGFNMSSIPRRSQLQIVTRLTDKLPFKLQSVVKSALKNNDIKIYEYLPEPSRDPLIEDNPHFLSQFVQEDTDYDFFDKQDFREQVDTSKISLSTDGHIPDASFVEDKEQPPLLDDLEPQYSFNRPKRVEFKEALPKPEPLINHQRVFEKSTTTTTKEPPTIKITRSSDKKPIRVSIISKDSLPPSMTSTTTTTTTTEAPLIRKYVEVSQANNNHTNLLFQLEKEQSQELDYDLSSSEIAAMVNELQKYEVNEVDFNYNPHPLEFPDHPEHPASSPVAPTVKSEVDLDKEIDSMIREREKARPVPHIRRPPPPHNFRRPMPPPMRPFRPPMRQPPPMRINDVTKSEMPRSFNKECDYFSNEICLLVQDYPIEAISDAIERNPELSLSLLPREEQTDQKQDHKLSQEGGFLCPSKVAYGKIKKAKSTTTNKWKYIVNYGDKTQTLRIEKCLTPGDKCSYVMPHYRTACTQVYNYHRLLSWDSDVGLHVDVYKVPTCCTCHVQGYYMPGRPQLPQSPVINPQRRRAPPPPPPMRFRRPEVENIKKDDDLGDLLKQYSVLRDKIAKQRVNTTSSQPTQATPTRQERLLKKSLNLIETVLMRKKRKNAVTSPEKLKQLLKKLKQKNKSLSKEQLLLKAKRQLRMIRDNKNITRRNSRSMKKSLKNVKNDKNFMKLLSMLKNRKLSKKRVNYNYHPIMDFIGN